MAEINPTLQKVSNIVAEAMGQSAGEDFYKLYEFETDESIITGAKVLLDELLGPEIVDSKLALVSGKS